ncbi:MAG: acetamidase/formamidase family protein [Erysipelotrichaceae bacterium]|nr:acetamidase/formamidase family protein [Erysipelotrichaceae bacterium]
MKTIDHNYVFALGENKDRAIKVEEGELLVFDTNDCFNNQIDSDKYIFDKLDWEHINPATGPVYLENATVNDCLKVEIIDIKLASEGTMCCLSDNGVLGKDIKEARVKKSQITEEGVYFNDILLPLRPMIGVIGNAPANGSIPCGTPGSHGGNMDNLKITKGSTLYLPIYQEGAYFALGDVHATMGDGEIMVSGIECNAQVSVRLSIIKDHPLTDPMLEDADHVYTIASDEDIEKAIYRACKAMNEIICQKLNYDLNDAGMLMSACGDLQFCQVVDPKRTVRFAMPKKIITSLF